MSRSLATLLLVMACCSVTNAQQTAAEPVGVDVELSPLDGWIDAINASLADHADRDQLISRVQLVRLAAAAVGLDVKQPIRGDAVLDVAAIGTDAAPPRLRLAYRTLRPVRFERRHVHASSSGQFFVEGERPADAFAYAASDGSHVLLSLHESSSRIDQIKTLAGRPLALRPAPLGVTQPKASGFRVALNFDGWSESVRLRHREQLTAAIRDHARKEIAKSKKTSPLEKRVALEFFRLLQDLSVSMADVERVQSQVILANDSSMECAVDVGWRKPHGFAARATQFDGIRGEAFRSDLHVSIPPRVRPQLAKLIELAAESVRAEATKEKSIDYLQPSLKSIEQTLLRTIATGELNASLAVVADGPSDAGLLVGVLLDRPRQVDAALRSFLSRVGTGPTDERTASEIRWMRLPSDDENAQPFWTGYDERRFWMLFGTVSPDAAVGPPSDRSITRGTAATRVPTWLDLRLHPDRLLAARAALARIQIDLPPASAWPTSQPGQVVRLQVGPSSDNGLAARLDLPPSVIRHALTRIESP